jgi:REP element-mobilizing transposase RayT
MVPKYNPEIHHRRSIRLKGHDYSETGAYFVTVCTQNRECLFGDVIEGEMRLNEVGKVINRWWKELNQKFITIETDVFIVMPNHIHGIITIVGADLRVRPSGEGAHIGAPLHKIIQWFKTMTTNEYIHGIKQLKWQPFVGKLWQRNYHERIVRNESELNRIREYITLNPARWAEDEENPMYLKETRRPPLQPFTTIQL